MDRHRDRAQLLADTREHRVDRIGGTQVGTDDGGPSTAALDRVCRLVGSSMPFGIAHVKRDGRTLGREGARQRWPHATTGAGDEHHAIRQPQVHAERIAFSP